MNIVRRALEAPVKKLAENAGFDGSVVLENIRRAQAERKSDKIGLDVLTGEYVDMVKAGIIDPAKVTRSAVENAASIAAMVLTTEAMITDKPEPELRPRPALRWRHGRHGLLARTRDAGAQSRKKPGGPATVVGPSDSVAQTRDGDSLLARLASARHAATRPLARSGIL